MVDGNGIGQFPSTNDALRRAARKLGNLYDEALAPIGLKATQLGLLWQMERLGGEDGPTLHALAERLSIGLPSVTYALRPLVRDGFVELRWDKRDKRAKHAVLTALGLSRLRTGKMLWELANRRVEALLGSSSTQVLRALAAKIGSEDFSRAFKSGLASDLLPDLPPATEAGRPLSG